MAKSSRAAAAQRAAQMRAEAARKEGQRKQVIAAVVAVTVIIIAVVVGVVIANRPQPAPAATGADAALTKLVAIPPATLDAVPAPDKAKAPTKLEGGTAIGAEGKPKVLYVGAEFCPFCAMERWALIGTLSRFGTFTGLKATTSSSTDTYPDTPTWSMADATYTSDHITFEAVETQDRLGQPLETLEGQNKELFTKFNPGGGIPWVTFNGTHATGGATVDAAAFEGKSYDQIIAGVLDPTSDIGRSVGPAINLMTAQICAQNGSQPATVCASTGVQAASVLLNR